MDNNINSDNGKKDLTHLAFEEYFESDWRKHFQDKDTIQNILDAAEFFRSHDFVQINSRYLIDDNRIAIIALLRRKNTKALDKLIIDVIAGNPTFEQFMDVVYGIGSDCDYRLMIYDENTKNESEGIDYCDYDMDPLIDYFKGLASMSLMEVDCIRTEDNISNIKFKKIKTIKRSIQLVHPVLPDRRIFEEAEFWGPYVRSCLKEGFSSPAFVVGGDFFLYYSDPVVDSVWTADGFVITAFLDGQDEQEFNRLIEKHKDKFNDNFEGCTVLYKNGNMIVKQDIPFRNFIYALPKDKWQMVEDFRSYELRTLYFVEEIFYGREI